MDSKFVAEMRQQLALQADVLWMDIGTDAAALRGVAGDDRGVCSTFHEAREAVSSGFGCDPDELVVTSSTTDSLCKILGGLELRKGDEIVTSNHEHYGSRAPMAIARDRLGVVIKVVRLPVGFDTRAEDFVDRFASAITSRTRVLLFSAPTATTGALLPIVDLARLAQQHRCITVVDGAHLPGMLHRRFRELGVDFLAGSGNKWQCGPPGTGILYIRNKVLPRYNPRPLPAFWPLVSIWYPLEGGLPERTSTSEASYDIAEYIQTIGSASLGRMRAFQRACELWDAMGRDRIENHVLGLSAYLKERIAEVFGAAALYSPMDDSRLVTAISSFNPFGAADSALEEARFVTLVSRLQREYSMIVRHTSFEVEGSSASHHAIRIATRPWHDRHDVDRLVGALAQLAGDMA